MSHGPSPSGCEARGPPPAGGVAPAGRAPCAAGAAPAAAPGCCAPTGTVSDATSATSKVDLAIRRPLFMDRWPPPAYATRCTESRNVAEPMLAQFEAQGCGAARDAVALVA